MSKKHPDLNELLDCILLEEECKEEILTHIKKCNECHRKFIKIKKIINNLFENKIANKKNACLDENLIAGYVDNLLPPALKKKVETHIMKCPYCFNLIIELYYVKRKEKLFKNKLLPEKIKKYIKSLTSTLKIKIRNEINRLVVVESSFPDTMSVPLASMFRSEKTKDKENLIVINYYKKMQMLLIPLGKDETMLLIKEKNGVKKRVYIIEGEKKRITFEGEKGYVLKKGIYLLKINSTEVELTII